MDLRKLTDDFSVSPQVDVDHMREIAGAGFKSVICNRPDNEDPGQPDCDSIFEAATAEGLESRWIPVSGGMFTPESLSEFRKALEELPRPVLAYCRSGTRCTMLWAITQHGAMDDADIAERAAKAGYDVSGLLAQLSRS